MIFEFDLDILSRFQKPRIVFEIQKMSLDAAKCDAAWKIALNYGKSALLHIA